MDETPSHSNPGLARKRTEAHADWRMPPVAKIPPNLHDEVLLRAGRGETSAAITEFLKSEYGIEVDSSSVRRLVKRNRDEIADCSRAAVREELRKRLLPAVRRLVRSARAAEKMERR